MKKTKPYKSNDFHFVTFERPNIVQSIVSLTSSLMTNSLTVAKVFSKTFIAIQIFLQKLSIYLPHFKTEILTSRWLTNSLSFEEMGPDFRN